MPLRFITRFSVAILLEALSKLTGDSVQPVRVHTSQLAVDGAQVSEVARPFLVSSNVEKNLHKPVKYRLRFIKILLIKKVCASRMYIGIINFLQLLL